MTPHRVGRCRNATEGTDPIRVTALVGCGAKSHSYEAPRKGEFRKQSSELFSEEGDSPRGGEMS